jgi:hypothetical protein
MSDAVERRVTGVAAGWADASWTRGRSLRVAAMALREEPWIERVNGVRRGADGRVWIDASYRRPVALVRGRDAYRLVDASGVRLPGLYAASQAEAVGLPVIVGCTAAAPVPGEAWPSDALRAGLALIAWIDEEPFAEEVTAIDVAGRDTRGRLRLAMLTAAGGRVTWGLPPGQELAVEPDAHRKLELVRHVHRTYGSIDADGQRVDVTGPQIEVRTASTL